MKEIVIQITGEITIYINVSVKNFMHVKVIVWNPATCSCENGKYLASIMDDQQLLAIMYYRVIRHRNKNFSNTYFKEKKATFHTQNYYILIAFSLITIALLIVVNVHCYLIKYRAKQEHLLLSHSTNNKLKKYALKT